MTTIIEDDELNTELQELYLVSKEWLSNMTFLENDLIILKKLFQTETSEDAAGDDLEKIIKIESEHAGLKHELTNYLHRLEPLIVDPEQMIDLTLLEEYSELKAELANIQLACHNIRDIVFDHHRRHIKKDKAVANK